MEMRNEYIGHRKIRIFDRTYQQATGIHTPTDYRCRDIGTAPEQYGIEYPLAFSREDAQRAANLRTRLNPFSSAEQRLLIKAGYAGSDATLKARGVSPDMPANFPTLP